MLLDEAEQALLRLSGGAASVDEAHHEQPLTTGVVLARIGRRAGGARLAGSRRSSCATFGASTSRHAFDLGELGLDSAAALAWNIAAALTDAIEADAVRQEEA